jgi:nitronate monooxygenase
MSALETALQSTLGIEYPIVQAPIGSVSSPELAAAVSNAGGLGTLAVSWRDPEATRAVLAETAALTDGPFAANLVLDDRTAEYPIDEHLDAVLDTPVDIVSFSFGDPTPYVDRCLDADVTTMVTVGSAAEASAAAEAGAEVVVAQGWEAGGHLQSDVATMPLVPRVVDAVPETPVVAAGGVADGRGVAAALALGADGVWLGTRFVATREANAHPRYKEAVAGAAETDTRRTSLFDGGWPGRDHRTLENTTVQEWDEAGQPEPGDRPGEGETLARMDDERTVERYDDTPPLASMSGDVVELPQYAGQSAGLTATIEPAGDLVETLAAETRRAVDELISEADQNG